MAIKILITLEGSEEVKSSLNEMAKSGEAFMQQFQGLSAKAPFVELTSDLEKAKPAIESSTRISHGFAESLRVAIPALRLAGVEVGNFAGFSRLASLGVGGLAIAIGASLAVALSNLEDGLKTIKGQLTDLFQSSNLGKTAFDALAAQAQQFGTSIADLAPGFEALTTAWQRFVEQTRTFKFTSPIGTGLPSGMVGSIKNLTDVYDNFLKLLRAGRIDQGNAEKAATAFFKALQNGGKLTADILQTLPTGTIQLLAAALGQGEISAERFIVQLKLAPIALDKLLEAVGRFGPQSEQAFKTNAIITYKDKLGEILQAIQQGFKDFSGMSFSDAIVSFLEKVKQSLKSTTDEIQLLIDTWTAFKNLLPSRDERLFNVPLPQPRPKEAGIRLPATFKFAPIDTSQIGEAIDKIDQEVTPEVESLGKRWGEALWGKNLHDRMLQFDEQVKELFTGPGGAFGGTTEEINKVWSANIDKLLTVPPFKFEDALKSFGEFITAIKNKWKEDLPILELPKVEPAAAIDEEEIKKAGGDIATSWQQTWQKIFDFIKKGMSEAIVSPAGAAEFTGGSLLQQQQQIEQQQQQAAQTQPLVAPFQEADNQIRTIWIDLLDYISTSLTDIDFTPLTQALVAPFTNALPGIRDALLQVEQMIREIIRQALEAGQIIQQLNQGGRPGGGGGGGFIEIASGGYIRGPGTATSDSIPAWLSNREYVIQAKAVDHYGANLFAALNSMRLPKDLLGSFAMGGLAKALSNAMPRYATGGMATATASSGRSLTIVLDGQRFGLNGSADVIDKLERVATMQGIASIGRPPGWVR